jgi:AmmeMemoRadiSam system protein B/AmmeMemoRadiSam system protein A
MKIKSHHHTLENLSEREQRVILQLAGECLAAQAQGRTARVSRHHLGELAQHTVFGCFVTARIDGALRGCCGFVGHEAALPKAVKHAAERTACDDHRFEPIAPEELASLHLDVWLLFEPEPIAARGEARREAVQIGRHGLQVVHGAHRGVLLPSVAIDHDFDAETFLNHTCRKAGLSPEDWKRDDVEVYTFTGVKIGGDMPAEALAPAPEEALDVRPAAVAGAFYPGDPAALARLVDRLLEGEPVERRRRAAVMIPHAGLKYSGRVAAEVLRRTEIPSTAIILCPKHTRLGANWAIAPHHAWEIPGGQMRADVVLARKIANAIPGLEIDADAHAEEHAIEVELPLLQRLAPRTNVVGVALGRVSYSDCRRFAQGLARVLRQCEEQPLVVISSDMNHFADDDTTRRLDDLALRCIDRLDPEGLLRTCRENEISMCGVIPAVIVMETLRELGQLRRSERIAYATSGDVSGDRSRVVGYAAVAFE